MQKLPYLFNSQIMGKVERMCAELYGKGITHYAFIRFYHGNSLRISDRPDWLRTFFEKEYYNDSLVFQKKINQVF